MGINTHTQLELTRLLNQTIGDDTRVSTTTDITTDTKIISTELQQYDGGQDGYFDDRWAYIEDENNAGIERLTGSTTYATATGTLTCYGSNFTADSNAATVRVQRHQPANCKLAIRRAVEQIYPNVHKRFDNLTLITGNALPNAHFEDQSTAGTPDKYTLSNVTGAAETSIIRGGGKSIKLTASSADGYMYVDSTDWPMLLDLGGRSIDMYAWVYPETADDAYMDVQYTKEDGTSATVSTTTSNDAGAWSRISREDIDIPENISQIQFRFRVSTNGQYVVFDDARVMGKPLQDLLLPDELIDGNIQQVLVQGSGEADDIVDDIRGYNFFPVSARIIPRGSDVLLHLTYPSTSDRRIQIIGYKPLETLSADTDTITLDTHRLNLIIAYAAHLLYEMEKGSPGTEERDRYEQESRYWLSKYYQMLPRLAMGRPPIRMWPGMEAY